MTSRVSGARHAVATLGWSSVGTAAMFLTNAVTLVVLSRMLEPEVFGVLAVATTLGLVLRGIGPFSVSQAIVADGFSDRAVREGVTLVWVFGVVAGVALVGLASPLAALFGIEGSEWILRWWALVLLVQCAAAVPLAELQHDLRFKELSAVQVFATVVGSGVVPVVLASQGLGLIALYLGYLALAVLELVGVSWSVGHLHRPRAVGVGRMARATSIFSLTMGTSTLATTGDNLVVGARLGGTDLGLYSRAYRLMSVPAILVGDAVDAALFPIVRRARDDVALIATGVGAANALLALGLVPAAGMAIVTADVLVPGLLGDRWDDAVPIFQVLAVGMFFRVGAKPFAAVLRGSGRQHRLGMLTSLNAAMVVGCSLVGSVAGVEGVAAGVVVSLVVNYSLTASAAMREIDQPPTAWLPSVVAAIPVALVASLVAAQYDRVPGSLPALVDVGIAVALGGLVVVAALALPPFRDVVRTIAKLRRGPT